MTAALVDTNSKENVMKIFARIFAKHDSDNMVTVIAHKRLAETMPGETGAVAAARLGYTLG